MYCLVKIVMFLIKKNNKNKTISTRYIRLVLEKYPSVSITKCDKEVLKSKSTFIILEEIFPLDSDKEKLRRTFSSLIEIEIISDNMDNIKKCKTEVEKMLAAAYAEKKITGYKKIVQSLSFEEVLKKNIL